MSVAAPSSPRASYRLQLRNGMTFRRAEALLPYLEALGVSHVYCSPCMEARSGSPHGYDVVDPTRLDPALGGERGFERFVAALHRHGLAQILDWVPNHVGIANGENPWWQDVLEHGRASPYAEFFDIDWEPARPALHGKVLLPVLGGYYGAVLEGGELEPTWDAAGGLEIRYLENRFPISPDTGAAFLLEHLLAGPDAPELPAPLRDGLRAVLEPLTALGRRARRAARAAAGKRALADLVAGDARVRRAVEAAVDALRGEPGDPRSYERLHRLLERQHYRLAYWRVSGDEVNYRRFFDIDELAALRMEVPEVFARTHERLLAAVDAGDVAGVRIDHVDGLADPRGYCASVRRGRPDLYLVVEKILGRDERLREEWPVDGTTGYDFLNELNGLFVDPAGAAPLDRLQRRFTGETRSFEEILHASRKRVMHALLPGELDNLVSRLDRIAQQDRHTRDYTRSALRDALEGVVAWFPVYRTYVDERGASPEDRRSIAAAVQAARQQADDPESGLFEWIERVLTGDAAANAPRARRQALAGFVARFQQHTAPVMAKGLEDTSFYRHHRLISLNEVGGDPRRFGCPIDGFHAAAQARAARWPGAMLCTASHDTKRGEDTRARIDVLSELHEEWAQQVRTWARRNRGLKRRVHGAPAPSSKDEYLIYQVLLGTWPLFEPDPEAVAIHRERIQAYVTKALREAKERTSWRHPDVAYERAVMDFVSALLAPGSGFPGPGGDFLTRVAELGASNGLAATTLKLCAPGVPDIYQGCELWDFSLADPDNRRPVDFDARRSALAGLERDFGGLGTTPPPGRLQQLLRGWRDGRIKLYLTWRLLALRRSRPGLFAGAAYLPIAARGEHATRVCAFARRRDAEALLAVAPRLVSGVKRAGSAFPLARRSWGDGEIALPPELRGAWRDVLTGRTLRPRGDALEVAEVFAELPVAVLVAAREEAE